MRWGLAPRFFPSSPQLLWPSLSNPRTSCAIGTWNVSQMRSSVVTVMGRPASICCQCRAEKPKLIISSWLYLCFFRSSRMRRPSARKNLC